MVDNLRMTGLCFQTDYGDQFYEACALERIHMYRFNDVRPYVDLCLTPTEFRSAEEPPAIRIQLNGLAGATG